jgi:hypothetical protein
MSGLLEERKVRKARKSRPNQPAIRADTYIIGWVQGLYKIAVQNVMNICRILYNAGVFDYLVKGK